MSTQEMDKKEFYRTLIRLAGPIALQSLMLASVAAADALMLGRVAQDQMTAVSLICFWRRRPERGLFSARSTGARETGIPWRIFSI